MKKKLERLAIDGQAQSFICYRMKRDRFDFFWHYHPEYELTFIIQGRGKRLVGDSYQPFTAGDLVLLGPNLPHTWIGEPVPKQHYSAVVIQFSAALIDPFLGLPEMRNIAKMLTKSSSGLSFTLSARSRVPESIVNLPDLQGVDAVAKLLTILDQVSQLKSGSLASDYFQPLKGKENERRFNRVCQYVQQHFSERLSLAEAASLIHLSESAFCKFFKKASGKTFSDYLNDIRVAHASVLLTETDRPVADIANRCGFDNLSYFNRVFLRKKKLSPRDYRKISVNR